MEKYYNACTFNVGEEHQHCSGFAAIKVIKILLETDMRTMQLVIEYCI